MLFRLFCITLPPKSNLLTMKKSLIIAAALVAFAACEKKETRETTVESENTVIETEKDTVKVDSDTLAETNVEASSAATPEEVVAVKPVAEVKVEYANFGDKILADKALTKEQMLQKYKSLKAGDTVAIKFKSKIKDVCQKKGCWMAMELPGGKESFVKFKDYAFFVPLNAANQEAIVSGKAFVSQTSVEQLRHYAKDGGESDEAIAKITQPKVEYKFMADGVLISK
jgi:hypothetical protein